MSVSQRYLSDGGRFQGSTFEPQVTAYEWRGVAPSHQARCMQGDVVRWYKKQQGGSLGAPWPRDAEGEGKASRSK